MGVRLALAFIVSVATAAPAAAVQRTTFQGLTDCTRKAAVQFKLQDKNFRRFVIDRATVQEDRFGGMVGNQYIPMIYSGTATYEAPGARKVMFVCLHAGTDKGAVFIYTLPR